MSIREVDFIDIVNDPIEPKHYKEEEVSKSFLPLITKARVFFLFFVLQTLPTQFFGNWKKNKRDFFQFYFFISLRHMPVQY